jgi:hypothetical protein
MVTKLLADYFVTEKVSVSQLVDGTLLDASSVLRAILSKMIPPITVC